MKKETAAMIGFILGECNDMIISSEGEDWIADNGRDQDGNITKLKPLIDIQTMDNYDIPTNMFVGGNPNTPNARGKAIRRKMHDYRNLICNMMGTYKYGKHNYKFVAPEDTDDLRKALQSANPLDTTKLIQFYHALTIPEKLYSHGEEKEMPWASVTFDHAPIVAAAAMFTSLKLDIKNAESQASDYMLAKIDAPDFPINKIEPTPFAATSYINQGDSLRLTVAIVAFDTTAINKIRWGMDEDTIPERWTETEGIINLNGAKPGPHRVKGVIGVQEKGSLTWKPWFFDYNVGQPMGVIAQPDMRVLYRGFNNILEGTASGFPADKVRLSSSTVNLTKQGNQWVAKIRSAMRTANISVVATREDGSSVNCGSYQYKVKPLPKPTAYFGGISTGSRPTLRTVRSTLNNPNGLAFYFPNGYYLLDSPIYLRQSQRRKIGHEG